jgi:hypothetical protein
MLHGVCLKVKSVGKPDAVAPHVRFDERGWETGPRATAPILDSTCATRVQGASGWKFRPENCRFIPVATQTAGQGDLPAEALGTHVSL